MTEQIVKCLSLGTQQNPQMFDTGDRTDPSAFCTFHCHPNCHFGFIII